MSSYHQLLISIYICKNQHTSVKEAKKFPSGEKDTRVISLANLYN